MFTSRDVSRRVTSDHKLLDNLIVDVPYTEDGEELYWGYTLDDALAGKTVIDGNV